jgi:putative transposon-encoded protein
MAAQKDQKPEKQESLPLVPTTKVRFQVYGEEMVDKIVKLSGNSGRVYLPPDWVGKHVKIIRVN